MLYATLFLWSFLAATVLPLGSEPALAGVVLKERAFLLPVLVATVGNYLGACTTYLVGRGLRRAVDRHQETPKERRAAKLVERYGAPSLALSWVPILGDAIVAVAGAARIHFLPFSFWTILGKFGRYAVVAWIALRAAG